MKRILCAILIGLAASPGLAAAQAHSIEPLVRALHSADPQMRATAGKALRELGVGARGALPDLIAALADEYQQVRAGAAAALGGIGPEARTAVHALRYTLYDEHRFVRSWGALALAEIGRDAYYAAPDLIRMLATDRANLRGRAWCADALPRVEAAPELAVPALTAALQDESHEVRSVAVLSLEKYGEPARSAVPALTRALQDEHWNVRGNAACALGDLGGEAQVPDLITALEDEAPYVRGCAAEGLGELGPLASHALPYLVEATRDPDEHVRQRASQALERVERR